MRNKEPLVPAELSNRSADNWRPLLAIADLAGGQWPAIARLAAVELSGETDVSHAEALLSAIQAEFTESRLSSDDLCKRVRDEHPEQFGSLYPRGLARQMKGFGIKPKQMRINGAPCRGYELDWFKDAFARYLTNPPAPSVTPLQTNEINGLDIAAPLHVTQPPVTPGTSGGGPPDRNH